MLVVSLFTHFVVAPSSDDYEEAMTILDRILKFPGSRDGPSSFREEALAWAAIFARTRFRAYGKPEHLEHAIYCIHTLLDGTSIEGPDHAATIKHLSFLEGLRLDGTNTKDVLSILSKSGKLPLFHNLIASLPKAMAVKPSLMKTLEKHIHALQASYINQLTDMANIKDGIKYSQHLLVSYPRSRLASVALLGLGNLLHCAFQCTHKIGYLNKAISATQDGINTTDSLDSHVSLPVTLIELLSTHFRLLCHEEDLHELMQLFSTMAYNSSVCAHDRFPISFEWVSFACCFGHPSAPTAYGHAMSWMQTSLTFAPTLDKQHSWLVTMHGVLHMIPLDYASYHIDTGDLKQAIKILEQGRALLWSQMHRLHTSIDQIWLANSNLADKFSAVNRELETLTMALSLSNDVDGNNDLEGIDPYSHTVVRKQKLLEDCEKLIMQIQALSGFDTFLKPPTFNSLRSAASHGPVIMISHCNWQLDILILLHNSPPSLIPTSDNFYICANTLQDRLLGE